MKALLKSFEWVDIDTKFVWENQYNTVSRRIFDSDIIRIVDDIRVKNPQLCRCGYCGKQFLNLAEYEKHLQEVESKARKSCKGCFWHHVYKETSTDSKLQKIVFHPDGSEQYFSSVVTSVSFTEKGCSHIEKYGCCELEEHRKHKPTMYNNSYFVRNPYGIIFKPINVNVSSNVFGSWNLWLNSETLEWKLFNSREEYNGVAVLNECNAVQRFGIETSNKTLATAQDYARSFIEHHVKSIIRFNEMVTDDRYYTNPDGTIMNEVVLNGEVVKRPTPIKTNWIYKD